MPVYRIPEEHIFPDPELAEMGGLLGVGGDLSPERLMLAYSCWLKVKHQELWQNLQV